MGKRINGWGTAVTPLICSPHHSSGTAVPSYGRSFVCDSGAGTAVQSRELFLARP
ncbi:MAG: hypothetical protein KJ069_29585 [Anaerolineae bacterium]|nr:hypothetical protein [Anaerolineae bacterium]